MPAADPEPLSILHVDAEQGFSGGEVQVFLLLEGLRALGHDVALACPPGSRAEHEARRRGFAVHPVPMRGDLDLSAVARLTRVLRTGRFDLAHLHTGRATWLGALACARTGHPAISTRRMDRRVRRGPKTRWLYRRGTRLAVAISPSVAASLRAGGVPPARIRVVPSAVDPARVAPPPGGEGARLRAEWLAATGPGPEVVVLVLAALVPRKGVDVLLDAALRLEPARRPLVVVAGDGPERAALERRAAAPGARARLLGRRADVGALLSAADVLALPSHKEGLGVAALEGMAAGLPVLASRVGGLAEAVVHGRTGLLLPPGDVAAWRDGLERLVADADLRDRLGAAGPARVAEGFLPAQMTAAYVDVYREVLAEPAAAHGSLRSRAGTR